MSQFIICIDGLIGAGKSSLMQTLAPFYHCFPEPVSEWNLLPSLYTDPKTYGFPFQLQVLVSQFKQRQQFPDGLVLVERCPWTSRHVFAPLLLSDEELALYDRVHDRLAYAVDFFLYLDVDPVVAYRRLRQRSLIDRQISLDYLYGLRDRYASVLLGGSPNVATVDANRSLDQVQGDVVRRISSLSPDA